MSNKDTVGFATPMPSRKYVWKDDLLHGGQRGTEASLPQLRPGSKLLQVDMLHVRTRLCCGDRKEVDCLSTHIPTYRDCLSAWQSLAFLSAQSQSGVSSLSLRPRSAKLRPASASAGKAGHTSKKEIRQLQCLKSNGLIFLQVPSETVDHSEHAVVISASSSVPAC